ncbi:alpha/beta hydrolase [Salipaludibacillus sp. CF4.18]|uniref:alpha/beta hydrolase n=1 Tax=Salipaludibacillus sp. CF4.18 TaxID=3373081 RepID=UPI003EE7F81F
MKKFIGIISSLIVLALIALMIAGDYFYSEAVERGTEVELHREETAIPAMVNEKNEDLIKEAITWYEEQTFEKRTITTYDDLTLEADFLRNEQSSGKAVILAHGFRSQRADMSDFVQFYHEQGFDILIPDSRGHGESEGDYIGFGWHDRLDYQEWIQELIDKENSSDIFLHGVSMGAGTVLMTSGEDLPKEVKGVISDSGYTSAEDILTYQLQQIYQLPAFPIIQITSGLTQTLGLALVLVKHLP